MMPFMYLVFLVLGSIIFAILITVAAKIKDGE